LSSSLRAASRGTTRARGPLVTDPGVDRAV
jgi:hypothetical protein